MSNRRDFLTAGGTGLLLLRPETAFGSAANSMIEYGLVGCGNRGNWIAPFFQEFGGARAVALADVMRDKLDATRQKFNVDAARAYHGPDAYRELAHSRLDAVVIESPPYFHPEQAMEAVNAGKHVYLAKPVAVDVPGCQTIRAAARKAEGRLSFLVDFQTRAQPVFQEAARRVHRGDIGKPALGQVFYYAGRPSDSHSGPGVDPGKARVMHFFLDRVLSGDIIVEQNIHVIDVANWFLNAHPVSAFGTGGRADWSGTGYDAGDAWDHYAVTYWYPDNVHVSFSSNQLTRSFADLCVRCFGVKGSVDAHYNGLVRVTGENAWNGAEKDLTFRNGTINNIKAFVESIRTGKPVNNAEDSVVSNLTAILGRTAAYQQRIVTWDEMMRSNEKWEAKLQLRW